MKTQNIICLLAITALLVGTAGCDSKKEVSAPAPAPSPANATSDALKETGAKVVADVKEAGTKLAADVAEKAKEVAGPINTKAQELLDAAKRYVSEGKLQEALANLKALSGEQLSTEQQAVADNLRAQVDKLRTATSKAATDAATAAGNLFKK